MMIFITSFQAPRIIAPKNGCADARITLSQSETTYRIMNVELRIKIILNS